LYPSLRSDEGLLPNTNFFCRKIFDISGYNLKSPFGNDVNSSVLTYHRIIEAFKFSYALRSWLGDPDFNSQIDKVSLQNSIQIEIALRRVRDFSPKAQFTPLSRQI